MRGLFTRKDGIRRWNNVTKSGRKEFLRMQFRGNDTAQIPTNGNFFVGLCQVVPSDTLTLADMIEPTIGVNGYARIAVTRDSTGWPTEGDVGNEPFIRTKDLVFVPTGAYDQLITRLFITPEQTALVGELWALSGAFADTPIQLDETTILAERTFNYDVFTR